MRQMLSLRGADPVRYATRHSTPHIGLQPRHLRLQPASPTVAACLHLRLQPASTYGCRYEMLKDAMARGALMPIMVGMEAVASMEPKVRHA